MNEHPFTYCTIGHCYDPILSATIFTHDAVYDTNVNITLWVDHATILTRSHSRQNLIKTIHYSIFLKLGVIFPTK